MIGIPGRYGSRTLSESGRGSGESNGNELNAFVGISIKFATGISMWTIEREGFV
jgi:hypothetical protein